MLQGPLATPVAYGEKSGNVTLHKLFEIYANIRSVREFPGVPSPYAGRGAELVVVRENVKDLDAGIEHTQTPGVAQCRRLISQKGCAKIVRLAFEFTRSEGRATVHRATETNTKKLTKWQFTPTVETVPAAYPETESHGIIVDNCADRLTKRPEPFDEIVPTNTNGDIPSDIPSDLTSDLTSGLGFAPSANLGEGIDLSWAVRGSAPRYAGRDVINPTAAVLSAAVPPRHQGMADEVDAIEAAVLETWEVGTARTPDDGVASTAGAAVGNRGRTPAGATVRPRRPLAIPPTTQEIATVRPRHRRVVGADVFVESGGPPGELGPGVEAARAGSAPRLQTISNRGAPGYPPAGASAACAGHYRFRPQRTDPRRDRRDGPRRAGPDRRGASLDAR